MYYFEQTPKGERKTLTKEEYTDIVFRFSVIHLVNTKCIKVIRRGKAGATVPKYLLGEPEERYRYGGRGDRSAYRGN